MKGAEFFDVIGNLGYDLGELGSFGGRYPGKLDPVFVKSHHVQKFLRYQEPAACKIISADVVAVARVAARYQHPVGSGLKRFDDKPRIDP